MDKKYKRTKYQSSLKSLIALYKISFNERPQLFLSLFLNTLFMVAATLLTVYLPKLILDGLQQDWDLKKLLIFSAFLFLVRFLLLYLGSLTEQKFNHETGLYNEKMRMLLADKIMKVRYEFLEDPEILEKKAEAVAPIQYGYLFQIIEHSKTAFISILMIISIAGILFSFSPWIFLIITFFALLSFLLERRFSKTFLQFEKDLIPINRKYNYYFEELLAANRQKEHRLYNIDTILHEKVTAYNLQIYQLYKEAMIVQANAKTASIFFNVLTRFLLYGYAGLRILGIWGKKISLGNFSLLLGANENYTNSIRDLGLALSDLLLKIPSTVPFLEFLSLPETDEPIKAVQNKPQKLKTLSFENVSFKYPKTDKWILKDVSFSLNAGEVLAIVGRNNAGKSTIVKLICRLFEPDSGRILWNGIDIREFGYTDYLNQLVCVFQDFQLFPLRIWENISCQWICDDSTQIADKIPADIANRVWRVLEQVDLKGQIEALPDQLNTWLDKSVNENATEFSGGQRQKLAIARAIYPASALAILDEPTAALDPLAESEVYGHFAELIQGKTAIFISHRMSASKFCDRILVLDQGQITGNGNHEQLLQSNALYQELYQAQAEYYA